MVGRTLTTCRILYFTTKSSDISESSNIFENDLHKIKTKRLEHFNTFIADHLNLNSIRNKFEMVAEFTTNFDIFLGGAPTSTCHFFFACSSFRQSVHPSHLRNHISGTVHHMIIILGAHV